ncbi:MAG: hypothetical protein ABFC84_08640 [Veillonellales bacterium]
MEEITFQELLEKYPSLHTYIRQQHRTSRNLTDILADCGYRFARIEDIVCVQKDKNNEVKKFLECSVVKIQQCL